MLGTPLTYIGCGSRQLVFGSGVELSSPTGNHRLHLSIHGLEEGVQRSAFEAIYTEVYISYIPKELTIKVTCLNWG